MSKSSNTPRATMIDKMLEHSNIEGMLETTNASVSQIAIEYLERMTAAKGITRENLASKLGITRQTVASRFRTRNMSLDDYVNTCTALDINPAETLTKASALAGREAE